MTRPLVSTKGKGNKGNFKKNGKQVATPRKKPKSEIDCFYFKGNGHWKRNCPKYLADKKDGKVNKGISHIPLLTLPSFLSAKYLGQFRF